MVLFLGGEGGGREGGREKKKEGGEEGGCCMELGGIGWDGMLGGEGERDK